MSKQPFPLYDDAIQKLSRLGWPSTQEDWRVSAQQLHRYFNAAGLTRDTLSSLNAIVVTGFRGQHFTCALLESILRRSGYRTGLLTWPALCETTEQIRLDGVRLDRETFAFEVQFLHARFREVHLADKIPMADAPTVVTCLALRVFHAARLDVAILQSGDGGRFDPTHAVPWPVLCGLTSMHAGAAAEMATILKKGVPVLTTPQFREAREILHSVASELGTRVIDVGHAAVYRNFFQVPNPVIQRNAVYATLAIHLARFFEGATWTRPIRPQLSERRDDYAERMHALNSLYRLPTAYVTALTAFRLTARQEKFPDAATKPPSKLTFYLDVAHTAEDLLACARWFGEETATRAEPMRFLLFNGAADVDPISALRALHSGNVPFDHVFFVPSSADAFHWGSQRRHLRIWDTLLQEDDPRPQRPSPVRRSPEFLDTSGYPSGEIFPSVVSALGWFRRFARERPASDLHLLVTGSVPLLGDVLRLLRRCPI